MVEVVGRDAIHPFPARMAPSVALEALQRRSRPLRVFDPMAGSGTVLAVSRAKGHQAIGLDVDPLAVLIATVWTTAIDVAAARAEATAVLKTAQRLFTGITAATAYPNGADAETKRFIRYWFDVRSRKQLTALVDSIQLVPDQAIRNSLWCGFSRLIIAKQAGVSLAMDLSHSRPHRVYRKAPVLPFEKFLDAMDRVLKNSIDVKSRPRGPATTVRLGDARVVPLADCSVDLVVTSPPYLNAIDYMRCSKFSLVWMGYGIQELREVRSSSIGTENTLNAEAKWRPLVRSLAIHPPLSERHERMLLKYAADMHLALSEVARVLARGGRAVYVVGENTIRGSFIPTAELIKKLAQESGLQLRAKTFRDLAPSRRYLPPPSKQQAAKFDSRMGREVILTFVKSSRRRKCLQTPLRPTEGSR